MTFKCPFQSKLFYYSVIIFVVVTRRMFVQDPEIDDVLTAFILFWLVDEVPANQKWIRLGRSLLFNKY